jgi:hypothetical protein
MADEWKLTEIYEEDGTFSDDPKVYTNEKPKD